MAQREFFMPMILPRTTYQQHRVSVKKIKKQSGAGSESNSGKDEYLRPVFMIRRKSERPGRNILHSLHHINRRRRIMVRSGYG